MAQRVPLQLQPSAVGRDNSAFQAGYGLQCGRRQPGRAINHIPYLTTSVKRISPARVNGF
jgi:hypothetical protein